MSLKLNYLITHLAGKALELFKDNKDGTASIRSLLTGSDVIQPTDLQTRYSETIQTHSAVSVAAGGYSSGQFIDLDGFDEVVLSLLNDAATNATIELYWSHDGINRHGYDKTSASTKEISYVTTTKFRYLKIVLYNGDTVAHTMSTWAFLKV